MKKYCLSFQMMDRVDRGKERGDGCRLSGKAMSEDRAEEKLHDCSFFGAERALKRRGDDMEDKSYPEAGMNERGRLIPDLEQA